MIRKDRLIKDPQEVEALIQRALVCRLAMADENGPYVVPLCFGYHRGSLYFHTGLKGKKLDILEKNNKVCFEFDLDHEIKQSVNACEWSMKYKSVIGFGKATIIRDHPVKQKTLDIIMQHYSDKSFKYPEEKIRNIFIIKVDIESITGKQSG